MGSRIFGKQVRTWDATSEMKDFESRGCERPIRFVKHSLQHTCDEERSSHNIASVTIRVDGVMYQTTHKRADGPLHALDDATRDALAERFGKLCVSGVRCVGYRSEGHFDDPDVHLPDGLQADAEVTIGFVAAVNTRTNKLVDFEDDGPHVEHIRWNSRARGRDIIDASMTALNDAYNWFALNVLGDGTNISAITSRDAA